MSLSWRTKQLGQVGLEIKHRFWRDLWRFACRQWACLFTFVSPAYTAQIQCHSLRLTMWNDREAPHDLDVWSFLFSSAEDLCLLDCCRWSWPTLNVFSLLLQCWRPLFVTFLQMTLALCQLQFTHKILDGREHKTSEQVIEVPWEEVLSESRRQIWAC